MPIYEYECQACELRFERLQKMSEPPVQECPECGEQKVERVVSPPAIRFKGSGWYVTDYSDAGKKKAKEAEKDKPAKADDKKSAKSASDSGGSSKSSESSKSDKSGKKSSSASSD